jgi:hypothetical protein
VLSFLIDCAENQAALELSPFDDSSFQATLRSHGVTGTASVLKFMSQGLATLVEYFSANWKGWQGSKNSNSLEGELSISARSDSLGHVFLDVRLRDGAPATWTLQTSMVLEPGALARLANSARQFEETVLTGSE